MSAARLRKALVCHPWMEMAGSELVTVWTLEALKGDYELHLCTAAGFEPELWRDVMGSSIRREEVNWIKAPRLPGAKNSTMLPHLHRGRFERFCRGIAGGFDVVISGYNPITFDRPALQIIGDHRWRDMDEPVAAGRLKKIYRRSVDWAYYSSGVSSDFTERDWFVANSRWALERFSRRVPHVHHEILYPPVPVNGCPVLPEKPAGGPHRFVTLGRVAPEKKIEDSIGIIEQVRAMGHDATLTIVGNVGDDGYGSAIRRLAASRPWVILHGPVYGEAKIELLKEMSFGIQACPDEPFGIAVAELAYCGCLTWVSATSGSTEIIPDGRFHFSGREDAAGKIDGVLRSSPEGLEGMREKNRAYIERHFLPEAYVRKFRKCLEGFLEAQEAVAAGS